MLDIRCASHPQIARFARRLFASLALAAGSGLAGAQMPAGLTPMGAERTGNADGTIPAWTGGLTTSPAEFHGDHYPDPFATERPILSIDAANVDRHREHLTPGQIELLRRYGSFFMNVYPTHRSGAYPQAVYDATATNPARAKLADGGNGVIGTKSGIPFPLPRDGVEAIWNHVLAYKGDAWRSTWLTIPVLRDGSYVPTSFTYTLEFHYGSLAKPDSEKEDNKLANYLSVITAPPRSAGQVQLAWEYVDQARNPRQAWAYNAGLRRVRLAPELAFDSPGLAADGLRTSDEFWMFNGSPERFDWKLVGKREIYVPYNAYRFWSPDHKVAELVQARHPNPEVLRYELHRVWIVDATLKAGTSHIYSRRTYYLDEDTWNILLVDKYDRRGALWRFAEAHPIVLYDRPFPFPLREVHYDFDASRYLLTGVTNESPRVIADVKARAADFTPQALRAMGIR